MSDYLILNIAIIIVPLVFTFEKKIKYYKKLPAVFISILIVGSCFILFDFAAVELSVWKFNGLYIMGLSFFNLPIEEILFFVTVPYSLIFLYEIELHYLHQRDIRFNKKAVIIISIILLIAAALFYSKVYTFSVLMFTALLFIFMEIVVSSYYNIFNSNLFWYWIGFSFIPFLVVNSILTSLPIVIYSPYAVSGIRFFTIPIEDFIYSFSMLSLYLLVYTIAKEKLNK